MFIGGFRLVVIIISYPNLSYSCKICMVICYYVVKNNNLNVRIFSTEPSYYGNLKITPLKFIMDHGLKHICAQTVSGDAIKTA